MTAPKLASTPPPQAWKMGASGKPNNTNKLVWSFANLVQPGGGDSMR